MITRENYEIYFIDYMDGNLSERERAEVEAFLLVHPDLQEQLDGMGDGVLCHRCHRRGYHG